MSRLVWLRANIKCHRGYRTFRYVAELVATAALAGGAKECGKALFLEVTEGAVSRWEKNTWMKPGDIRRLKLLRDAIASDLENRPNTAAKDYRTVARETNGRVPYALTRKRALMKVGSQFVKGEI